MSRTARAIGSTAHNGGLRPPSGGTFDDDRPELIGDGADAVLVMHTPLEAVRPALAAIARHFDGPRGAYPHAGHFERPSWVFKDVAPDALADEAEQWARDGAQFAGGCCGTRPEHIRAIAERFPDRHGAGDG